MAKLIICLVLSALLMVQKAHARHGPKGFVLRKMVEDAIREKVSLKNTDAQNTLVNEKMKEFTGIMNDTIKLSVIMFEKVIKEAEETEYQCSEFRAHLKNMTLFTESVAGRLYQAPENAQLSWIFEEFEELLGIMDRYDLDGLAHPTEEEKYFKKLLYQHRLPQIQLLLALSTVSLVEGIDVSINDYIKSLTPEQKEFESEFIAWFTKTTSDEEYNKQWLETLFSRFNAEFPNGKQ